MIAQRLAINAVMNSHARRAANAPRAQADFWRRQIERYAPLVTCQSEMEQSKAWHYPQRQAASSAAKLSPLKHLRSVSVGIQAVGDVPEIVRFRIDGDVAYRDRPENLVEQAKGAKEIHLEIDTPGGDGRWSFDFCARIRAVGAKIIATARNACSAGAIILQCADVRRITADGCVLVHGPQCAILGSIEDLEALAKQMRTDRESDIELFTIATGQARETVEGWLSKDTWFTPSEAVAAGLADEVIA